MRGPRWKLRRRTGFWRRILGGMGIGAVASAPLGGVIVPLLSAANDLGSEAPVIVGVLLGALLGLPLGAVSGLLRWMQVPVPGDDPAKPDSLLASDRRLVVGWGGLTALVFGLPTVLIMPAETRIEGFALVAALVLWVPLAVRTWPRFQVARTWLAARGDLPGDVMSFLRAGYKADALRPVGVVYQFRHRDIQEHLAKRD